MTENSLPFISKVSIGQRGKEMMSGELASMTGIHNAQPDFAPLPIV